MKKEIIGAIIVSIIVIVVLLTIFVWNIAFTPSPGIGGNFDAYDGFTYTFNMKNISYDYKQVNKVLDEDENITVSSGSYLIDGYYFGWVLYFNEKSSFYQYNYDVRIEVVNHTSLIIEEMKFIVHYHSEEEELYDSRDEAILKSQSQYKADKSKLEMHITDIHEYFDSMFNTESPTGVYEINIVGVSID